MKRAALFAATLLAFAVPAFAGRIMSEPTVRVGGQAMFPSKTIVANAIHSADHTDFHVRENVAEWAGYSGTIDWGGGVQMHRGVGWLTGRFQGSRFVGRLEVGAWSNQPSWVYTSML